MEEAHMKLTVEERLILLGTLPREGDFTTLKIVRKLRESLSFTEEEHKALGFVQEENEDPQKNRVKWNQAGVDAAVLYAEIDVSPKSVALVAAALEKLNKEKKLTEQHFSLYEKFCATKEEER